MIKCILFDSDGTLVDSEYLGHLCMEHQLQEIGIQENAASMKEKFRGWKLGALLESLQQKHNYKFDELFIYDYRSALNIMFKNQLKATPGILAALQKIDLPICVASSGPMSKITLAMKVTGLQKYFGKQLFSAYDIDSWKPEPDLFLHAAKSMGFEPKNCLVVEDSLVGLQAALAANMTVIHYNPEKGPSLKHESVTEIYHMDQLNQTIIKVKNQ